MRNSLAGENVLIYGAGRGGELLLREILNNRNLGLKPVGFVDDDPLKVGKKLLGFPILGAAADIPEIRKSHPFTGILVAFRIENAGSLDAAKQICRSNELFLRRFSIQLEDLEN